MSGVEVRISQAAYTGWMKPGAGLGFRVIPRNYTGLAFYIFKYRGFI